MDEKLIDRQRQVPFGFRFYDPVLKWTSAPWASFDQIVTNLISRRMANPELARKYGWSTDYATVADEVDVFNAKMCVQMGWLDYVTGGGRPSPPPFSTGQRSNQGIGQKLRNVAAGGRTLVDWIKSGSEAVPVALSEKRAEVCIKCQFNEKGGLLDFFTTEASEAIRRALEDRERMNLSTIHDGQLNVCGACNCPLKLKVHMPISDIMRRLSPEVRQDLPPHCWILLESK